MEYGEFLDHVQKLSGIRPPELLTRAVRATFETLGERIDDTERHDLAAELPAGLKEPLFAQPDGQSFPLDEFYGRIAARSGLNHAEAVKVARAVMVTLHQVITSGELGDVLTLLPDEFLDLFVLEPGEPQPPAA